MKNVITLSQALIVALVSAALSGTVAAQTHVYEGVEETFTAAKTYDNAYIEVDLWIDLNGPDGLSYRVPAFWDGGQTFRVRLVATKPGKWTWSTGKTTGDRGLDSQSGSFKANAWTKAEIEENPNRRGFIRVASNIPAQDPQKNTFDKFHSASMGKLKDFMLDPGHDYRVLQPARDHLADPDKEFQCLALAPDKRFGLGFIAAHYSKRDIVNLIANTGYNLEWYNIDTGVWSSTVTVATDESGKLIMPSKPNTHGWAYRIKRKQ